MTQIQTLRQKIAKSMLSFLLASILLLLSIGTVSAQIAVRGSATTASSTNTNLTINKPTGVAAGDILFANIVKENNGTTNPSLSGWTLISGNAINGGDIRGAVLYKIAGSSEPTSYTFALGSNTNDAVGSIVAFSGVNSSNPFDVTSNAIAVSTANGTTATASGYTTVTAGAAAVLFAQASDNNSWSNWSTTSPGTLTELYDNPYNGTDDLSVGAAWATKSSTGATGNGTVTQSGSDRWGALMVVLRPCIYITSQPVAPATLCAGNGTRSLSVSAVGSSLSYSWRKDGVAVSNGSVFSGQGTANLTITNPGVSDAGAYTVLITAGCGTAVSNAVSLTVNPIPTALTATSSATLVCSTDPINLTTSVTTNSSLATTILSEDFNAGTNSWTKTNTSSGGTTANAAWTLRADGYSYNDGSTNNVFNSNDNSQFYLSNSDAQGSGGTTATILQSPSFSTVGYTSANINFYHHYRFNSGAESGKLEVSTDGTTWTTLSTFSSTQGSSNGFVLATASLASYLNQATVYIRFKYDATFDWYWAIDNVSVSGNGTVDPSTYQWTSNPVGFSSSLQNPTGVVPASSGIIYAVKVTNSYGCEATSSTSAITFKAATQITSNATPTSQTIQQFGSPAAISVSATGTNITYQWYENTVNSNTGGTSLGSSNGAQTNSYSPAASTEGTKYYYCIVSGECGNLTSTVVSVTVTNVNVWTGSVNNDFSNPSNWSLGVVPASTTNATINSGTASLTASVAINNLSIASGAALAINGQTLTINGAVSGVGMITGSHTSNLTIGGTAGTLYFTPTGTGNYLKNFTLNNGATATLGNLLNITGGLSAANEGTLTVTGTATLTTGGFLVIKSNEFGTARIAPGRTTGGYISGDVSVERYIPMNAAKSWRLLANNTSGQTIKQAWQENQSAMANGAPGYGAIITSPGTLSAVRANGFDTTSQVYSLFKYNELTDNLDPITNTNTAINQKEGYFLFVRGDRSAAYAGLAAPVTATTLRSKGAIYSGDQSAISVGQNLYKLANNPYPSRIDMRQIVRTGGVVNAYQVWDAKLGGAYGVGAYQTFTFNGSNYVVSPGGGSYGANGSVHNFIESGAAFFVQSSGTAGTIQVVEAAKTTGSANDAYRPTGTLSAPGTIAFNLYANNASGASIDLVDGGLFFMSDANSNTVDIEDVKKSPNFTENFGILSSGTELVVEKRAIPAATDTLFFQMYQMRNLSYTLQIAFNGLDVTGSNAFLFDKFTNTSTLLNTTGTTSYTFTVSSTAASKALDRFKIIFRPQAPLPVTFQQVKAYRSGTQIAVEWEVSNQINLSGYVVEKSTDGLHFTAVNNQVARDINRGLVTYQWMDASVQAAVQYYRIKSVDISGSFQYSMIVKVVNGKNATVQIYPSPVKGNSMNLQIANSVAGNYEVRLTNLMGQVMLQKRISHSGGNANFAIALPQAVTIGQYQVEILGADGTKKVQQVLIDPAF